MSTKVYLTFIVSAIYLSVINIYSAFQGSFESQIAVKQLEDSSLSYGLSNLVINSNFYFGIHVVFWIVFGVMWLPTIITFIKKQIKGEK